MKLRLIVDTPFISIYSPRIEGEKLSEFEKFLSSARQIDNQFLIDDFNLILASIDKLRTSGAKENLFRLEGGKRHNLTAVPLLVNRRPKGVGTLRLYCIRICDRILIIGNGGIKKVQKYQDDPSLFKCIKLLAMVEDAIYRATKKKSILYDDAKQMNELIKNISINYNYEN